MTSAQSAPLCQCGCGGETSYANSHGVRRGEPFRFKRGHRLRPSLAERISTGYEVDGNGCWIWQGVIGMNGYGFIANKRKRYLAHRVSYELHRGPIPGGLQIDHLCRNRACVNPDHLEPVTQTENARRGSATNLTFEQAVQIARLRGTCTAAQAAAEFPVGQTAVRDIWHGRTWRDASALVESTSGDVRGQEKLDGGGDGE